MLDLIIALLSKERFAENIELLTDEEQLQLYSIAVQQAPTSIDETIRLSEFTQRLSDYLIAKHGLHCCSVCTHLIFPEEEHPLCSQLRSVCGTDVFGDGGYVFVSNPRPVRLSVHSHLSMTA